MWVYIWKTWSLWSISLLCKIDTFSFLFSSFGTLWIYSYTITMWVQIHAALHNKHKGLRVISLYSIHLFLSADNSMVWILTTTFWLMCMGSDKDLHTKQTYNQVWCGSYLIGGSSTLSWVVPGSLRLPCRLLLLLCQSLLLLCRLLLLLCRLLLLLCRLLLLLPLLPRLAPLLLSALIIRSRKVGGPSSGGVQSGMEYMR